MTATLSELEQQNPNVRSQIQVWQRERTSNGQSPADWAAFRQHAMAIGAPDPGQEAPSEFAQSAAEAESSAKSAASAASSTMGAQQSPPQAQPQQPQMQQPTQAQPQQPQWQPQQSQQQPLDPALLQAIKIKADYEADKKTPTDRWLKARGMTQAELDAALKLAATAEGGR